MSTQSTVSTLPLWSVTVCGVLALVATLGAMTLAVADLRDRRRRDLRLAEAARYRVPGAPGSVAVLTEDGEAISPYQAWLDRLAGRALGAQDRRSRLAARLDGAGLRQSPERWLVVEVTIAIALAAALSLALTVLLAVPVAALLTHLGCAAWLRRRRRRRREAFEQQLPDALRMLAGSLRVGFGLNQALAGLVRECDDPIASELNRALGEIALSVSVEDALAGVGERMASEDMRLVVLAVRTAREVGGNLAEVMSTTVQTMRERSELRGQVKVLSAEGRISAKVLVALPLFIAGYLLVFRRSYLHPLYSSGAGIAMIVAGALLLVIGTVWLSRITRIEI